MITYTDSLEGITFQQLNGFFVGWSAPLTPQQHLDMLRGSAYIVLAQDSDTGAVVGFVNALSDGFHAAFIPNLEVLPAYQGQGIGTELMRRILAQLDNFYAVDLLCDIDMQPFYEKLGMQPATGMLRRNYKRP